MSRGKGRVKCDEGKGVVRKKKLREGAEGMSYRWRDTGEKEVME